MDLWIRSQDKMKLVSNPKLIICQYDRNMYYEIEDRSLGIGNYTLMGCYSTKERALEVLDEIQKILKSQTILNQEGMIGYTDLIFRKTNDYKIKQFQTDVYEMPKEYKNRRQ